MPLLEPGAGALLPAGLKAGFQAGAAAVLLVAGTVLLGPAVNATRPCRGCWGGAHALLCCWHAPHVSSRPESCASVAALEPCGARLDASGLLPLLPLLPVMLPPSSLLLVQPLLLLLLCMGMCTGQLLLRDTNPAVVWLALPAEASSEAPPADCCCCGGQGSLLCPAKALTRRGTAAGGRPEPAPAPARAVKEAESEESCMRRPATGGSATSASSASSSSV